MSLPISGFTAVPNPMMLSFLASQGFAIMYFGGAGWQFGKRKVSGMSNDEVNAMTPEQFLDKLNGELKGMVPSMQQGMKDMTPLINTTITQFGSYIREAIKAFPEAIGNILRDPTATAGGIGSDIFGVRYDPGAARPGGNYQTTREYWEAVAANALKQAGSFYKPSTQVSSVTTRPITRQQQIKEFGSTVIKPQLSLTEQRRLTKRRAGQSQYQERNRLIQQIALNARNMRSSSTNSSKEKYRAAMGFQQQRLVNLLARYRFD